MKCHLKLQILLPHTLKIVYNIVMIIKKKIKKPTEEITNTVIDEDVKQVEEGKIDLFNLDNIDFKQRQERRKGDRRRGFRRIDDRNLISRAREEAQSIKQSAYQEGYQEGISNAQSDLQELKSSIFGFLNAKQEVFDKIAPDIMEISLDIAKKIIKNELQQDPTIIFDNIMNVLKDLSKEETKIALKVNPTQVSIVKQELPEMIQNSGMEAKLTVIPDNTIMEGGCMITTSNGMVDATIETQLAIISEALKGI